MTRGMAAYTPVQQVDDYFLKRDDLFEVAGVRGGKARTCWSLAQGAVGLVTAGSRSSPQVNIVAHIARDLGIPCRVHTPEGEPSPEVADAVTCGAELVQHPAGYNSVIKARAHDDAEDRGWTEIPFGMECEEAVRRTAAQTANVRSNVKRIVVPVGSGMSLAGILNGLLDDERRQRPKVLGIVVGADPVKRLDRWAPWGWMQYVDLVSSGSDYHAPCSRPWIGEGDERVALDAHYEAKAVPFMEPGDLLWVVGIRATAVSA